MSPRILVLGASGFIGRHLIQVCGERGLEVIGTSRVSRSGFVQLDPLDPKAFDQLLSSTQPSAIVNCIGLTAGTNRELVVANVAVVSRLLEVVRPETRIVQIGSAAEYGSVEVGLPIAPDAPTHPLNEYGVTKLEATCLVVQARERGAQAVVLRVFNPLGPGLPDSSLPGRAVVRFKDALDHRQRSVRFGSLEARRDFLDVRDVADALIAAATLDALPPSILNLGSGVPTLARSLVRTLAQIAGFDGEIIEDADGSPRAGQIAWQCADVSLSASSLGWGPRRSLDESLEWMWHISGDRDR